MATMPINARGYTRISTDLQLDGVSLEIQRMRISDYCNSHNYNLLRVYEDVLSGKDVNRPALQEMLADLQPNEVVLVVDLSRLSRTTLDALQLIKQFNEKNVGFVTISQPVDTTTAMGRAMITFQMVFNQLERENTAAKVKGAMQSLKLQGKLRTRPPFGWKYISKDSDYIEVPEQQRVLKKIKELYASGLTANRIASVLNQNGDNKCLAANKKSPEKFAGALFHQATVQKILIENDCMEGKTTTRKPISLQIISHRKSGTEIKPFPDNKSILSIPQASQSTSANISSEVISPPVIKISLPPPPTTKIILPPPPNITSHQIVLPPPPVISPQLILPPPPISRVLPPHPSLGRL